MSVKAFNVLTTAPFTRKGLVKQITKPFTSTRGWWHSWTSSTGLTRIPAPLETPCSPTSGHHKNVISNSRCRQSCWQTGFPDGRKGMFFPVFVESHFGQNETKCKCFCISREWEFPWALQLLGVRDFSFRHCRCHQGNKCSSFELCFGFVEDLIKHSTFWIREFCPKEWAFQDETLFCQTFP